MQKKSAALVPDGYGTRIRYAPSVKVSTVALVYRSIKTKASDSSGLTLVQSRNMEIGEASAMRGNSHTEYLIKQSGHVRRPLDC